MHLYVSRFAYSFVKVCPDISVCEKTFKKSGKSEAVPNVDGVVIGVYEGESFVKKSS